MSASISVTKSQSATIAFAFQNTDGSNYDLIGATVTLTVRKNASSTPILTLTPSLNGNVATFSLSATDTDQDVRAWQAVLDLQDAQGVDTPSRIFYLVVTERQVTTGTSTVTVGDLTADGTVDVTLPDNTVDKYFRMDFTPATTVSVAHNLGKRPAVTVIDSAGDEVEVDVQHLDDNNLTLTLAAMFGGTVFCN